MHHPTDRITHTTAFFSPVVEHWLEREIAQWVHPMKDRSDDPSHHERTSTSQLHPTPQQGARCSSMTRALMAAKGHLINHSWWSHQIISSVTKAVVHIKDPMLLIGKESSCSSGNRFPISSHKLSFNTCPTPYNHIKNVLNALLNKTSPPTKTAVLAGHSDGLASV